MITHKDQFINLKLINLTLLPPSKFCEINFTSWVNYNGKLDIGRENLLKLLKGES
jgi:hypothetical protein